MTPSVDTLAVLINGFGCAMLTVIDPEGRPRTRPMTPLKAPFNGHLWFKMGTDAAPAAEIGRGADVSVAYGTAANGPYVTVYGWAIVLRNPAYVRSLPRTARDRSSAHADGSLELICVTARAAEMWDSASTASRRIFAFSNPYPICDEEPIRPQKPVFAPRLVRSATSCAQ